MAFLAKEWFLFFSHLLFSYSNIFALKCKNPHSTPIASFQLINAYFFLQFIMMHTYFFSCVDDSVIHLSFFERDAEAASILQYNSLLQRLSASSSFAALFPSQSRFTCILLVSPCAPTSTQQRQRSRNSISFVLESSAWTCDCAIRDIMALELVPYPHAFFSPNSFYFTWYSAGKWITSLHLQTLSVV